MTVLGTMLTGCGNTAQTENSDAAEVVHVEEGVGNTDNDIVKLTVWSEEANWPTLNKMIDSFKAEYAGQAEFEITLVQETDAETKNVLLRDVYAGADIFLLQMIS